MFLWMMVVLTGGVFLLTLGLALGRAGSPASVAVVDGTVTVTMRGVYKVAALRGSLSFPAANVSAVRVEENARSLRRGRRFGTYVPGGTIAGTFTSAAGKAFWAVEHRRAVVLDLQDERFTQVVVEVGDPDAVVAQVRAAAGRSG